MVGIKPSIPETVSSGGAQRQHGGVPPSLLPRQNQACTGLHRAAAQQLNICTVFSSHPCRLFSVRPPRAHTERLVSSRYSGAHAMAADQALCINIGNSTQPPRTSKAGGRDQPNQRRYNNGTATCGCQGDEAEGQTDAQTLPAPRGVAVTCCSCHNAARRSCPNPGMRREVHRPLHAQALPSKRAQSRVCVCVCVVQQSQHTSENRKAP